MSGKLAETLDELSVYMETVEETQRKVKSAMYYPIFIVGFLAVTLFVTFTFIIPRFKTVYDQLNFSLYANINKEIRISDVELSITFSLKTKDVRLVDVH